VDSHDEFKFEFTFQSEVQVVATDLIHFDSNATNVSEDHWLTRGDFNW
jgi:hypothetical protein